MTAIMDLSFPGEQTDTATSCIPDDSVYMLGPRAGKSDTWKWLQNLWSRSQTIVPSTNYGQTDSTHQ